MAAELRQRFVVLFLWAAIIAGIICLLVYAPARPDDPGARIRHPQIEMYELAEAMQIYKSTYGDIPTGDNRTILRALRGQNPQKTVFLECQPQSVSPDGDFLDNWETPFKFYFSSNEFIIRSAGPNKRFDDAGDKGFDDISCTNSR